MIATQANAAPELTPALWRQWLPGIALVLLAFAAYWPALRGDFVFDDVHLYVLGNRVVQADDGLYRIWCTTQPIDFYPLTHTTYWLEWRLWGPNTLGYHVFNVLLHVATAFLVWRLLARLGVSWAWLAAAIFLLHPVNVQAVAWISQRKSLLAAFFGFASLLCYLRFDREGNRRAYCLALVLAALAHMGKSSMLMIPVVLTGYVWCRRGRLTRRDLYELAPFYLLTLFFGLASWWFQQNCCLQHRPMREEDFLGRVATAGWAVWFYLYELFVPLKLALIYPKWKVDASSFLVYVPGLLLVVIAGACYWRRRSWGLPLLAGLGYFIITMFPVLGFVDVGMFQYCLVSDHYQYQSMIGVIAVVVAAAAWAAARYGRFARCAAVSASGLLLAALFATTWCQAHIWTDGETLWRDTIAKTPTAYVAHYQLGKTLFAQKRYDEAMQCYRDAIERDPKKAPPHVGIGLCYSRLGDRRQAEQCFRTAIALSPESAVPYVELGNLLRSTQPETARSLYCDAIDRNPCCAEAHNGLGIILSRNRSEEAKTHFQRALKIDPTIADAHNNLGNLLAADGDLTGAADQYRQALRLEPNFAGARRNLELVMNRSKERKKGGG